VNYEVLTSTVRLLCRQLFECDQCNLNCIQSYTAPVASAYQRVYWGDVKLYMYRIVLVTTLVYILIRKYDVIVAIATRHSEIGSVSSVCRLSRKSKFFQRVSEIV